MAAQQRPAGSAPQTGWLPRVERYQGDLTATEKAEVVRVLDAIEHILQEVPELAHPDGITAKALLTSGGRRPGADGNTDPRNLLEYRYHLDLCDPGVERLGCGSIMVDINVDQPPGQPQLVDARGREIWAESVRSDGYCCPTSNDPGVPTRDTVPGQTELYYRLSPTMRSWVEVYFLPAGESFWSQITREELYEAVLFGWEKDGGGPGVPLYRQQASTSPYGEWLAGAEQRRKEREEALAGVAAVQGAAEVEKLRKELEETERQVGEQLRAEAAQGSSEAATAAVGMLAMMDSVRNELDAMSPAERRMPAMFDLSRQDLPALTGYPLIDRESLMAQRLFAVDPEFWHYRRSRVEVRSIEVRISASTGSGPPPPSVHRVLWAVWQKLDWRAFRQLLEPPGGPD